ncbi:MAG: hypothetical protein WBA74_26925 [Cyclobacteriaceae bacterium]
MKHLIIMLLLGLTSTLYAQTVNSDHLNPSNTSASGYRYLKLGSTTDSFGGILLNVNSATYGNGNDLTFFTYDNRDMNFRTGNGNFIVFPSSGGKVGIGTTSPQARLEVNYSGTMGGFFKPDDAFFRIKNGTYSLIMDNNEIYSDESLILGSSYSKNIEFRNVSATDNETLMALQPDGDLGIGTTTPNEKLDVRGNIRLNDYSIKSGGNSRIDFGNAGLGNENDDLGIYIHNDGEFEMRKNDLYMMNVTSNFNIAVSESIKVGVGTTSPTHKLSVNGIIRAKEILVEASPWPDYVFTDDYDLQTLEEVSAYIKANGHLPNIPSAQEVEANGVVLGEMNASLLEKIEELTLYAIEQQQKVKDLEKVVADQDAINLSLIKRLEKLESEK